MSTSCAQRPRTLQPHRNCRCPAFSLRCFPARAGPRFAAVLCGARLLCVVFGVSSRASLCGMMSARVQQAVRLHGKRCARCSAAARGPELLSHTAQHTGTRAASLARARRCMLQRLLRPSQLGRAPSPARASPRPRPSLRRSTALPCASSVKQGAGHASAPVATHARGRQRPGRCGQTSRLCKAPASSRPC